MLKQLAWVTLPSRLHKNSVLCWTSSHSGKCLLRRAVIFTWRSAIGSKNFESYLRPIVFVSASKSLFNFCDWFYRKSTAKTKYLIQRQKLHQTIHQTFLRPEIQHIGNGSMVNLPCSLRPVAQVHQCSNAKRAQPKKSLIHRGNWNRRWWLSFYLTPVLVSQTLPGLFTKFLQNRFCWIVHLCIGLVILLLQLLEIPHYLFLLMPMTEVQVKRENPFIKFLCEHLAKQSFSYYFESLLVPYPANLP